MAEMVRSKDRQMEEMRARYAEMHRRCLEHIEILLYQQDYAEALRKIDQYKQV